MADRGNVQLAGLAEKPMRMSCGMKGSGGPEDPLARRAGAGDLRSGSIARGSLHRRRPVSCAPKPRLPVPTKHFHRILRGVSSVALDARRMDLPHEGEQVRLPRTLAKEMAKGNTRKDASLKSVGSRDAAGEAPVFKRA